MTTKATLHIAPFGTIAVQHVDSFWADRKRLLSTVTGEYSRELIDLLNSTTKMQLTQTVLLIESLEAGIRFAEITGLRLDRFLTPWGQRTWEQLVVDDIRDHPAQVVVWLDSIQVAEREGVRERLLDGTVLRLVTTNPDVGVTQNTFAELCGVVCDGMDELFGRMGDVPPLMNPYTWEAPKPWPLRGSGVLASPAPPASAWGTDKAPRRQALPHELGTLQQLLRQSGVPDACPRSDSAVMSR